MELVIRATTPPSNSSRPTEKSGAGSGSGGSVFLSATITAEKAVTRARAKNRAKNGQHVAGVLIGAADLELVARRPGTAAAAEPVR